MSNQPFTGGTGNALTRGYAEYLLRLWELIDRGDYHQCTQNVCDYLIAQRIVSKIPLETGEYRDID